LATYLCGRTIGGLWANFESGNAWIWVNDAGWRKLDSPNTTDLLIVAAQAKASGGFVDITEDQRGDRWYVTQLTPTGWEPSEVNVSHSISECIYSWTSAYALRGPNVMVRIQLNRDSNVSAAELDAAKPRWRNGIVAKWSGHFACCEQSGVTRAADCQHACTLSFDVAWVTQDAHHTVAVHRGPGRADMLNWYHDDSGDDAAHEFGHMIGNKDEYPDPACPDRSPVNTGTVMAVVADPAVRRQVQQICQEIGENAVDL
jgi:hypothetical protein